MEYLLAIGLAMFAGLFLSRLASKFNLPDVTSYLVAGVLIGPLCLGALGIPNLGLPSFDFVEKLGLISDVSLGFIAFSIGNEFRLEELKHIGRQATIVAIFQALSATIFVDVGLLILHLFLGDTLPDHPSSGRADPLPAAGRGDGAVRGPCHARSGVEPCRHYDGADDPLQPRRYPAAGASGFPAAGRLRRPETAGHQKSGLHARPDS